MTNADVNAEIDVIKKLLVEKYHPQKIVLFGSFAWGNPNSNSDIDLLIIKSVEKPRPYREQDVYRILMKNFRERNLPVDIIVHTQEEITKRESIHDPFVINILRKGKVIYES